MWKPHSHHIQHFCSSFCTIKIYSIRHLLIETLHSISSFSIIIWIKMGFPSFIGWKRTTCGTSRIWQANRDHAAFDGGSECNSNQPSKTFEKLRWVSVKALCQLSPNHARFESGTSQHYFAERRGDWHAHLEAGRGSPKAQSWTFLLL